MLATVLLDRGSLASSGDYARGATIHGQRYSHILDPRTGWPVQGLTSVSVFAERCIVAGSFSTITLLKGREGSTWLEHRHIPHLWVDQEGRQGGPLASAMGHGVSHAGSMMASQGHR